MGYNRLLQSVQVALENRTQKDAILAMDEVVDFCIEHENGRQRTYTSNGSLPLGEANINRSLQ